MPVIRLSKIALLASTALFVTLVAFGNITDYGTNFAFVEGVLRMETIFPEASIGWRALGSPVLHHAAYLLIIVLEVAIALACWAGTLNLWQARRGSAADFKRAKKWGVIGLSLGFVLWQAGFMAIGGEWFGMWMSEVWNGTEPAFRVLITLLALLIYLTMPDEEIRRDGGA